MNDRVLISPSIIATDLSVLGNSVGEYDPSMIDLLHIDVMDGHFVPNLTFGPGYIQDIARHARIPLDIHLMIEHPEDSVESYLQFKPWGVTIHYESTRYPARCLRTIRDNGVIAGLAINPATPVEAVFDLLPFLDMVLIMSIDPGFYGQTFMETALGRISKLASFIRREELQNVRIQVDGGVNNDTIVSVVKAGARVIVVGSAAYAGGDIHKNVDLLKKNALKGLSI